MSAKPDTHSLIVEDIASFYDDPYGYVLYAFPWGDGGSPDAWQRETLESIGRRLRSGGDAGDCIREAVASGHGVGKSALVAWIILWAMSTRPHLNGVVTANTEKQLETKTWRELALWHKRVINAHWFTWTATKFFQSAHPETWFVAAIPWTERNSEAFAGMHGEHVLMIFDEASAIADIIWEVAEGAMTTDRCMWFAFGNPTRNTGRFRECWGKFRHRWTSRKVDSRTCKMVNQRQVQEWLDDYGEDSDFFKVRVRGEFPNAGVNQLIDTALVEAAMERVLPYHFQNAAPKVLGIDFALEGSDRSVVMCRQGVYVRVLYQGRVTETEALLTLVARIIDKEQPDAAFADKGGLGAPLVQMLRTKGHNIQGVNFGGGALDKDRFVRRREEMWWAMREWLERDNPIIEHSAELKDDLISPEYQFTMANKIQLESKDSMRKRGLASPDLGDALALTFAMPVNRKGISNYTENTFAKEFKRY